MKKPDFNEFVMKFPTSLGILQAKVIEFFERNAIPVDNVWFPDVEIILPNKLKEKQIIQVVLFGGFLERFFESGNWANKEFVFWCMSPKVKQVMVELLGFPFNAIRVIPRYHLFPITHPEKKIDLNYPLQIVYSGRLSAQKNIEMLLAFAAIMQERIAKDVNVLLLGEWDNQKPKSRGRFESGSYKETVDHFQKKISFTKPPEIINSLGHDEWLGELQDNSLLVNFSTFSCEDFGVSVAQAQSAGVPMLLSCWGAHCDVRAQNISLVDAKDIAESFSPFEKILLHAQMVVDKFLEKKLEKSPSKIEETLEFVHSFLSFKDLQDLRVKTINQYGYEIALVGINHINLYAESDSGKLFFREYFKIFSKLDNHQ